MTRPICISIVDDDASVRQALSSLVRSIGNEAKVFESAEAFVASGAVVDSAVLITDVQMPGMNGIELQELLRSSGYLLPVLFITAFPEETIRKRAYTGGASCFLSKPFDGDVLIRCIETALKEDSATWAKP